MPKVSVIIPTYNRARYICEAIDSVLAQTYKDYEIIVVDDGSTDNTREILKKYGKKIRYFYQENRGASAARNLGIKKSKGEYIAFLDSDDIWVRHKLERQLGVLAKYPDIDFICSLGHHYNVNGQYLGVKPSKPASCFRELLEHPHSILAPTVLVKKHIFAQVGLFDEALKCVEDYNMWIRMAATSKMFLIKEILVHCRQHTHNLSWDALNLYIGRIKAENQILKNYKNYLRATSDFKMRLAKNHYFLGKEYLKKRQYLEAAKNIYAAIIIKPNFGSIFTNKSGNLLSNYFKIIKPYLALGYCIYKSLTKAKKMESHKEKIRILYFEPSSGLGGSGNSLVNLLSYLSKDRFKPIVITFNHGPQFERVRKSGIEIIKLKSKQIESEDSRGILSHFNFGVDLLFDVFPVSLKLVFIIKKYRINLVHINTNIISGIAAILGAKIAGIPCICHIRQTRKLIRREKLFSKLVDRFIILNQDMENILKKDIPEEKLNIVYDGIDLYDFTSSEQREEIRKEFSLNSAPVVGIVGRMVEGKGHKDFIKAAAIITKVKPKTKFLIVGCDPGREKVIENQLKNLIKEANLDDRVIFTGWRSDIIKITSVLDIAVQASTFPEGFGLTCIEAMALSKPVIATNVSGPSEIVVDGETGILVPPGNPQALASAILRILDSPDLARKMGDAGRKRVEEMFNIKKNIKEIEQIYKEIF